MKTWFYEYEGKICGPVSQVELLRLILNRTLSAQNLVWTSAFGKEWRTIQEAGLVVSAFGRKPYEKSSDNHSAPRRPAPQLWAWILLLLPVTLSVLFDLSGLAASRNVSGIAFFFVMLIFFTSLAMDRKSLRDAGYVAPSFWWCLLLPGYFVRRLQLTGQGKILAVISISFSMLALVQMSYPENNPAKSLSDFWHAQTRQFDGASQEAPIDTQSDATHHDDAMSF